MHSAVASEPPVTVYPWENKPTRAPVLSDAIERLERSNAATQEIVRQLCESQPLLAHSHLTLAEYPAWLGCHIDQARNRIEDFTALCIAVRASTDAAEFDWRVLPMTPDLRDSVARLRPLVAMAIERVASVEFSVSNDEKSRLIYLDHMRKNAEILSLINDNSIGDDVKGSRIEELRDSMKE